MSCGGFVSAKLQKYEVRLLLAKKRRLGAERRCYELARECLLAIRRLDEKIKEMNLPETASEPKLNHHGIPWMQNPRLVSEAAGKGVK